MMNKTNLKVNDFLQRIIDWARKEPELKALALVGSYARGNANPESDVDLLFLVKNPEAYLKDRDWVYIFGKPVNIFEEDWGKVTSLRVFYADGLEVEYGLCNLEWGSDPGDEGDAQVIKNGMIVLYEKNGHLSSKLEDSSTMPEPDSLEKMNPKLIARYITRETLGIVGMGIALFWSAGRIDWWPAWASIAVMVGWTLATAIIIFRFNPDLLAERLGPRKGFKTWDTAIMSILGLAQLVRYIIAGLDQRYGWTEDFPLAAQITAFVLCALGYALFVWATASNPFFSQIVRIQSEGKHVVVKDGPYHYLRHPAYLGAMVYELAVSILLASWWALIVSGFTTALMIMRTALEDRTLQNELAGYMDYTHQTRFRLIPYVW